MHSNWRNLGFAAILKRNYTPLWWVFIDDNGDGSGRWPWWPGWSWLWLSPSSSQSVMIIILPMHPVIIIIVAGVAIWRMHVSASQTLVEQEKYWLVCIGLIFLFAFWHLLHISMVNRLVSFAFGKIWCFLCKRTTLLELTRVGKPGWFGEKPKRFKFTFFPFCGKPWNCWTNFVGFCFLQVFLFDFWPDRRRRWFYCRATNQEMGNTEIIWSLSFWRKNKQE